MSTETDVSTTVICHINAVEKSCRALLSEDSYICDIFQLHLWNFVLLRLGLFLNFEQNEPCVLIKKEYLYNQGDLDKPIIPKCFILQGLIVLKLKLARLWFHFKAFSNFVSVFWNITLFFWNKTWFFNLKCLLFMYCDVVAGARQDCGRAMNLFSKNSCGIQSLPRNWGAEELLEDLC